MPTAAGETAAAIVLALVRAGHEAYLVGGCVRDILRGVEPEDYDIVTSARPEQVRSIFPETVPVGEAFGVVLVLEGGRSYEVATFRAEGPYEDGRRPSSIRFASAEEDVRRRDFTVNGLLMDPATGAVIDLVGGRADLERRVIRAIGDPDRRFSEDHLRALRAVRFAANLGFEIEPATFDAIRRHAASVARVSAERVRDELTKLLTRGGARRGLELLDATGLVSIVLPEVAPMKGVEQPPEFHPEGDVWEHTLRCLALLEPGTKPTLAWGALFHDVGKPPTRSEDARGVHFYGHSREGEHLALGAMRRLRFSNAEAEAVAALVRHHMRFMHVKEMRPSRLKRFLRLPDFPLHLELHRLDCLASHGMLDNWQFCRAKLAELAEEDLRPAPLLDGNDLIAMGLEPGPVFREILRAVEDAQLDGRLATAEDARAFVRARWGDRLGAPRASG